MRRDDIDATGLLVLPGVIDVHLHFNEPGRTDWEGAATGSRALAAGGGTLFFDMPLNSTPCTVNAHEFDRKRAALEASSITDFALWGGLVPGSVPEMAEMAARGVVGFKAFMCDSGLPEFPRADDVTLLDGLREAARLDLPVAVHAESEELTRGLGRAHDVSHRARVPRLAAGRRRARGDPARVPAGEGSAAPGCTSSMSALDAASRWPPRRGLAASTSRSRPVRTISISPKRTSSGSARWPSARRRCVRRTISASSGTSSVEDTWISSRRIIRRRRRR